MHPNHLALWSPQIKKKLNSSLGLTLSHEFIFVYFRLVSFAYSPGLTFVSDWKLKIDDTLIAHLPDAGVVLQLLLSQTLLGRVLVSSSSVDKVR